MKMFVCTTCTADGGFVALARSSMPKIDVVGVECMSGCTRSQTVAFRSPGKVAYLFGDIGTDDLAELQNFAQLYEMSADGSFADARVLGNLRTKAIARIPG